MVKPANEEVPSNEPWFDDNGASVSEVEYLALDPDADDAWRPAGEAGLFGDPRPNEMAYDDQDSEPEVVRS